MTPIDIGIVVPLAEEFVEFRALACPHTKGDLSNQMLPYRFSLPFKPTYECVAIVCGGKAGQELARDKTEYVIDQFRPRNMVLLGIAGRLDRSWKLGDVIVANSVTEYRSLLRVGTDSDRTGVEKSYNVTVSLAHNAQLLLRENTELWQQICYSAQHERDAIINDHPTSGLLQKLLKGPFQFRDEPIATERAISAATAFVDGFLARVRNLAAIETEAAGFLTATSRANIPSLVLRGLSDPSDETKAELQELTRDGVRRLAARNATRVFLGLVRSGLFIASSKKSRPEKPMPYPIGDLAGWIAKNKPEGSDIGVSRHLSGDDETALTGTTEATPEIRDVAERTALDISGGKQELARGLEKIAQTKRALSRIYRDLVSRRGSQDSGIFSFADLDLIYGAFGIIVAPERHDEFTEDSFSEPEWQGLIKEPQTLGRPRNHLHFANELIASKIVEDVLYRRTNGEFADGTIRLLETGTGGCNTTFAVLQGLLGLTWQDANSPVLEYLGIDINRIFSDYGNQLFLGNSHWNPRGGRDERIKLCNPRIRPWSNHRFIETGNAPRKIAELVKIAISDGTEPGGFVDYFFTSYMIHHVPNGDALLRALLGPPNPVHIAISDIRRNAEYFGAQLNHYLRAKETVDSVSKVTQAAEGLERQFADAAAHTLAQYLRFGGGVKNERDYNFLTKEIPLLMASAARTNKPPNGIYNADWVQHYFFDPQTAMLRCIHHLLRPNGMLLIADLDGRSLFNRTTLAKGSKSKDAKLAIEMVVAHFRSLDRMCDILTSVGFQIARRGTVISTHGKNAYDFSPDHELIQDPDVLDNNLGYFIAARKKPMTTSGWATAGNWRQA